MSLSDNGWTAFPDLAIRPLVVNGVAFVPGIRDNDDVETVLRYVVEQYVARVEPLVSPGCWGFSFRVNVNSPNVFSNHASGTAIDVNAPNHPNGVPTSATFTSDQIAEVHQILAEAHGAVRWGGDFNGTPDAMHFEINVSPAELAVAAHQIREDAMALSPDDKLWIIAALDGRLEAFGKNAGDLIKLDHDDDPKSPKWSLERFLRSLKGGN